MTNFEFLEKKKKNRPRLNFWPRQNVEQQRCQQSQQIIQSAILKHWYAGCHFYIKKENALLVFATDMQFFDFQMIGAWSVNKSATYLLGCICKVQRTPMMEERPGMIVYAGPIFCYWKRWSKMRPHQTCWKCPIGQVRVLKFHFWGRLFLMGIGLIWFIFIKLICPLQSEYWDTMLQFHSCSGPLTLA